MKEYITNILIPAINAFSLRRISTSLYLMIGLSLCIFLVTMSIGRLPVFDMLYPYLFFIQIIFFIISVMFVFGYSFIISRNIGKGKKIIPKAKMGESLVVFMLTFIGILLFEGMLYLLSIILSLMIKSLGWILSFSEVIGFSVTDKTIAVLDIIGSVSILIIFLGLNLIFSIMHPILVVRYNIYQYYSRIFDIQHIFRLVFTKEYLFSFLISSGLFALVSVYSVILQVFLMNISSQFSSLIISLVEVLFGIIIILFSSVIFGRTFYFLETHYKIDHIPHHVKSEIRSVELSEEVEK